MNKFEVGKQYFLKEEDSSFFLSEICSSFVNKKMICEKRIESLCNDEFEFIKFDIAPNFLFIRKSDVSKFTCESYVQEEMEI